MAFVFARGLAIPVWAMAVLALVLTAPSQPAALLPIHPTVLIAMTVVGIALIVLTTRLAIVRLRSSRALVPVVLSRHRHRTSSHS